MNEGKKFYQKASTILSDARFDLMKCRELPGYFHENEKSFGLPSNFFKKRH